MKISHVEFLTELASEAPMVSSKILSYISEDASDSSFGIFVFAKTGDLIADHLHVLSEVTKKRVFSKIEDAMCGQDSDLMTAVATGLIEAFVACSEERSELWPVLEQLFGPVSLHHAIAWRDFY